MRAVCPHCNAAYRIEDARVPDRGANVKCTKCQKTFPIRKPAASDAVPLPGGGVAARPARAAGGPAVDGSIPLPAPVAPAASPPLPPRPAPLPVPPAVAAATPAAPHGIPLPPPAVPTASPTPELESPFEAPTSPFAQDPLPGLGSPFGRGPGQLGAESPFSAPPLASPPPSPPPPPLRTSPALPTFGEVDLGMDSGQPPLPTPQEPNDPFGPARSAPPPGEDPFAAAPAAPTPVVPGGSGADHEELEMLFGESPRPAPAAAPARAPPPEGGYQVRRRSGKIFGPFQEEQIVEMLSKGELLGNEDVSTDGTHYEPIGAVAAFGAALRKATVPEPAPRAPAQAAFGERMAAAKVIEGGAPRQVPRWVKWAAIALPVVCLLLAGLGAGLTRYGYFFSRLLRRGDPAAVATLLGEARAALAKGDFASERIALDLAARAVALDGGSAQAGMLHALAVATLAVHHGAPPEALAQARKATDALEREEKGGVTALAARLAMDLCAEPLAATAAGEGALDAAQARRKPDPEVVALLARSALARGNGAVAEAQGAKLAALEPGPRGLVLQAQGAALRKAPAEARAALDKALAREAGFPAAQVELAALEAAAGEADRAAQRLGPLLAEGTRTRLSPLERARALTLLGSLAAADPARAAEADKLLDQATAADPRLPEPRVQLVLRRIRGGDPQGAVAATEPVAATAAQVPALAAARVRALAAAGRALDAAKLADEALARAPTRVELVLAKAFALVAAGKPEDAKPLYADALGRDPAGVEARVALAHFALREGDTALAANLLGAAVEKGPRDPAARAVTGDLLAAKGDLAGAEAAYRKALELDPLHAPAEVGLARLARQKGDLQAARTALASAVRHEPRNAETLVELGTLQWKAGELGPAEASFKEALDADPRQPLALARLGAVLLLKKDAEGAVRSLTAASNERPDLVEARLWLGRALLAKGETPGAVAQLKNAVELARNAENLVALGEAYERSNALTDALDAYRTAAQVAPADFEPQERMALLLAGNGRCDQAIPAYQKAIELSPRLARLRAGLAECTARLGKHEEAVKLYQALLKSNPEAPQVPYLLARSLHQSKGMAAALPWYERAARDEPDNAMPHYYLGYAYKERGQHARAVQQFKAFLEKKPDAAERQDIEAEIEDLGGK